MNKPTSAYFVGTCIANLYYPEAGINAIQLLQREGIRVIYPQNQGCCAQPAFNSGFRKEALPVAASLLACFKKDIPIIVPAGSCAAMIKHHWPELFVNDAALSRLSDFSHRVYELTEFLVDVLKVDVTDFGLPTKVAIHDSCSARNAMKAADKIEVLLGQLKNVTVVKQSKKKECCGFGGTFAIKLADVSGAMVKDKVNAIRETGASVVVSQDFGCLMNIGGALKKQKLNIEAKHIAEFLWERSNASK